MSEAGDKDHVKRHIERAIDRARDGIGQQIDALDQHLKDTFDFKNAAADHAPQLLVAGAAAGFLAGFGTPRKVLRVLQIGLPLLIVASVAKSRIGSAPDKSES